MKPLESSLERAALIEAALVLATHLIKGFEGCRLRAYQDVKGVWTIGWGETLGVREGMVWTQQQADIILARRVQQFMLAVIKVCPLAATSPAILAACTSLAYNIGINAFAGSSIASFTRQRRFVEAAGRFKLWNKSGGKVWEGLIRRRKAESLVYLSGVPK